MCTRAVPQHAPAALTGSEPPHSCVKDLIFSAKEIEMQKTRIQGVKDNPEKDEHDVRKQVRSGLAAQCSVY